MAIKQNATEYAHQYPLAAKAVDESLYVNDGAESPEEAAQLQGQLQ